MHPILESPRRILLYLTAWVPILGLLTYVMWASGKMTWTDGAAILTPACAVYAFACLSPWYLCSTQPLRFANWQGLLATFGAAALVCSLVLVGGAWMTASALVQLTWCAGVGVEVVAAEATPTEPRATAPVSATPVRSLANMGFLSVGEQCPPLRVHHCSPTARCGPGEPPMSKV